MSLKNANDAGKNKVELTFVIDRTTFDNAVSAVFKKNVRKITVPGFRKGKAPRGIIEKFYGKGVFYEDALNEILPDEMEKAIKETSYEPCDTPSVTDVDFESEEGIVIKAEFIRRPDVKIGQYKGFEVTKNVVKVTKADVDKELEEIRKRYAREIKVEDRAAQKDDIADINYEGFVDGKAFAGGKAEGHKLKLGSGQFIPGFEDQIIGHSAGEEFDVNVKFPEDYHAEELKGKDATFKVKINSLEYEQLPELDDEFAKDASEFDTLAEYKKDIKAKIEKRNQDDADIRVGEDLAEALCGIVKADIPDVMYQKETDLLIREYDMNLRQQGLSLEMLMKYTGMKLDDLRARYSMQAIANVKKNLALTEIAKKEKIVPSEEDINARYEELAKQFNMKAEEVKERIDAEDIKSEITILKAFEIVKNAAVVTENEVSEKELGEIMQKKHEKETPAEGKKTSGTKTAAKKAAKPAAKSKASDEEKTEESKPKKTTRKTTAKTSKTADKE